LASTTFNLFCSLSDFVINGDKNTAEENTDKSRPVKVTLSDIEGKQMLMKILSKLKHAPEHSQLKKMSVTTLTNSHNSTTMLVSCLFLSIASVF
jgi:hypothetical protein